MKKGLLISVFTILTITGCTDYEAYKSIIEEKRDQTKYIMAEKKLELVNTRLLEQWNEDINLDGLNDLKNKVGYGEYTFKTYTSEKYGFSMEYPSFLEKVEEGVNREGVHLKDINDKVQLSAYSEKLEKDVGLQELYDYDVMYGKNLNIKDLRSNSYTLSWTSDGKNYYKHVTIKEDRATGFIIYYPEKDSDIFLDIITKLNESFKA